ncbi:hypothetical protein DERP_008925 [Dermatophagoides pteronyssinus]|uniref:Uncharacterized protein n=1 Tax=Dermatophagoides pteronyssinus TaxID=6956 RepID=A0ABQ8JNR3_DERPT|nr:hypothetical protein DERP_008925 [Dermatophagoides pteronyssinus]
MTLRLVQTIQSCATRCKVIFVHDKGFRKEKHAVYMYDRHQGQIDKSKKKTIFFEELCHN